MEQNYIKWVCALSQLASCLLQEKKDISIDKTKDNKTIKRI